MKLRFFILLVICGLVSCRKDTPVPSAPSSPPPENKSAASVHFKFVATADGKLLLRDSLYKTSFGDVFTVSLFSYYISNVKLHTEDSLYVVPDSYFLISHFEGMDTLTLRDLPRKNYKAVSFLIGVDSTRNVSGAQSGALDPAHNMFWDWNTGYIFYKLEGWYRSISSAEGNYGIHVGGYAGRHSALQEITLPCAMTLENGGSAEVRITANACELFETPNQLDFDTYSQMVTEPGLMQLYSQNYRDMFTVEEVQIKQ